MYQLPRHIPSFFDTNTHRNYISFPTLEDAQIAAETQSAQQGIALHWKHRGDRLTFGMAYNEGKEWVIWIIRLTPS